jgi:YidC/Oxa1 family membrane protein insertase
MTWDNGQGLIFTRQIAIDADYMFTVVQTVQNKTGAAIVLYPYASVTRQGTSDFFSPPAHPDKTLPTHGHPQRGDIAPQDGEIAVLGGRLNNIGYLKLKDNKLDADKAVQTSTGGWLGFNDKYWLVAAIPDQAETITAEFRHSMAGALDIYQTDYKADAKTIAPGQTITETSHLFAGAKRVDLLTRYRDALNIPHFDLAVDWGKFRFLTKPFFYGIDYLAKALGNFGLGILAFTVVIRILILPLAWKTFREMNRMTDLAPQLAVIKEKYAGGDKQAMQAEILELYQREKVNPVSGCLPMLFQIPIFLSLFKVLSTTIEMRQQPFYWYVHDLSAQDPTDVFTLFGLIPEWHLNLYWLTIPPHLGLLPLVLGCTLMALQLNGPKVADPLHQKMMLINPVIFTFFMAHLPVGLVIYYIWSNSISLFQQRFIRWFYRKRYRKEPATPSFPTLPGQKS